MEDNEDKYLKSFRSRGEDKRMITMSLGMEPKEYSGYYGNHKDDDLIELQKQHQLHHPKFIYPDSSFRLLIPMEEFVSGLKMDSNEKWFWEEEYRSRCPECVSIINGLIHENSGEITTNNPGQNKSSFVSLLPLNEKKSQDKKIISKEEKNNRLQNYDYYNLIIPEIEESNNTNSTTQVTPTEKRPQLEFLPLDEKIEDSNAPILYGDPIQKLLYKIRVKHIEKHNPNETIPVLMEGSNHEIQWVNSKDLQRKNQWNCDKCRHKLEKYDIQQDGRVSLKIRKEEIPQNKPKKSGFFSFLFPQENKEENVKEVYPRQHYGKSYKMYGVYQSAENPNSDDDLYTANSSGNSRVFNKHKVVKYNGNKMTLGEARNLWDNEQKSPAEERIHSFLKRMEEYSIWVEKNKEELNKWASQNIHPKGPIKLKDPEQIALNDMNGDLDEMIPYHGIRMPRRKAKFLNTAEYLYVQEKENEKYREKQEIERKKQEEKLEEYRQSEKKGQEERERREKKEREETQHIPRYTYPTYPFRMGSDYPVDFSNPEDLKRLYRY